MSANTRAKLIKDQYKLNEQLSFTGNDLVKVLGLKKNRHLVNNMDVDQNNIPKDHIGIFHERYCPWSGTSRSPVHCFHATMPSSCPIKTETKWYDNIDLAYDLLHKHTTHSSNTQECLLSKIMNLTQQEPPSKKQKLSNSGKLSCRISMASEDDAASLLRA